MFRKTLIASALSGALAVAGLFATPVAAEPGGQDYARVLLGIVTLGVIADAMDDNNRGTVNRGDRNRDGYREPVGRGRWNALPARCEYAVRNNYGRTFAFGETCLRREGVRVNRLPQQCEFRVRTNQGRRTVFASECLESYGYVSQARLPRQRR